LISQKQNFLQIFCKLVKGSFKKNVEEAIHGVGTRDAKSLPYSILKEPCLSTFNPVDQPQQVRLCYAEKNSRWLELLYQ
jgi:hypothetical protein